MKFPYNATLIPPAPFLPVKIANPADQSGVDLTAQLDTGADITVIPAGLVASLRLALAGEIEVESYAGQRSTLPVYDIDLITTSLKMHHLPAITYQADYVLLGRDVLNQLQILLDGPQLSLEVLASDVSS